MEDPTLLVKVVIASIGAFIIASMSARGIVVGTPEYWREYNNTIAEVNTYKRNPNPNAYWPDSYTQKERADLDEKVSGLGLRRWEK